MTNLRYGQIGVGALGEHLAVRMLNEHGGLTLYDLAAAKLGVFESRGATVAVSAKEAAEKSDVLILSLPDPAAVESVMEGDHGVLAGARPGALVIDTSSIDPSTSQRMHQLAKGRRVGYLEAPMTSAHPGSTGVDAARTGTFTVLAGGDEDDFERAKPVLQLFATTILHLCPAGSGSVMKLISNQITGIAFIAIAEGLALAAAAGFRVEQTLEVLSQSCARSYCLQENISPRVLAHDYAPGFATNLMYKDHLLAAELGQRLKVPMPMNGLALETYQMLRAQGRGNKHCTDVVNWQAEAADVDLYAPGDRSVD